MVSFGKNEIIILFLSISLMLGTARVFGEIFRRIKLPPVVGEILAGILIGPTILGRIAPDFFSWIFPTGTRIAFSIEVLILLGVTFLLFIAGLEVNLTSVLKQGSFVLLLSAFSIAIPFAMGTMVSWFNPGLFGSTANKVALSFFIGITLSITALPIIAKILLDLNLIKTDFGVQLLSSAMINDIFGWLFFAILIQLIETGMVNVPTVIRTVLLTIITAILILTLIRHLINKTLPWIQAKTAWPGGVISFTIIIGMILASITERIGIHAIFGAFLAGVAIGESPHLREHTREIIEQFINNIFAPLFFVSIGLRIDFIEHFNLFLALLFIVLVLTGKIGSAVIAGKIAGVSLRESLLIGSGMSASGAMGIILGLFALQFNIINPETFEAIVIMALCTSLLSSPLMKFFMRSKEQISLIETIDSKLFIPALRSRTAGDAIAELSEIAARKIKLDGATIAERVLERESLMSTGIGDQVAVPHARLSEVQKSSVVIGISEEGIDFNAYDGKPAHLIFLILTPLSDPDAQIQLLCEISTIFQQRDIREEILHGTTFSEFMSAVKMGYYMNPNICATPKDIDRLRRESPEKRQG